MQTCRTLWGKVQSGFNVKYKHGSLLKTGSVNSYVKVLHWLNISKYVRIASNSFLYALFRVPFAGERYKHSRNILFQFGTSVARYTEESKIKILPGGESNPGLPRDRRGYLPLYYRGTRQEESEIALRFIFCYPLRLMCYFCYWAKFHKSW